MGLRLRFAYVEALKRTKEDVKKENFVLKRQYKDCGSLNPFPSVGAGG
jgi:hypothetical protein